MNARFQAPRGTQDVLPAQQARWATVLDALRETARLYGFQRIDTPMFEQAGVFEKGSGETTDIVEKEMYVFEDRGGERLALTPEGTPAICRAYLEHGMASLPQPVRLYTTHAMFRYDRPQKGRYRQHTQFDCEVIGSEDPSADAEVIALLWRLYGRVGIHGIEVRLNSIDDPGPRRGYVEALKRYYRPHLDRLSEDSQRRFERNPLRLLDSKDPRDEPYKEGAPKLVDTLSAPAAEHFAAVRAALEAVGIPYAIEPTLVRGLDYYNRTVFEIVPAGDERAQSSIGGGGRYDGLLEVLGGPATPAVGFGSGIERIILEMERCEAEIADGRSADVYVVTGGSGARTASFRFAAALRDRGLAVVAGEAERSFRAQLRAANGSGAPVAAIIGEEEAAAGTVAVKRLAGEGEQETLGFEEAIAAVVGIAVP